MNILILCTGNSCRSQMAESFLKSFNKRIEVISAGTRPAKRIHPKAFLVMVEKGHFLDDHFPKSVDQFKNDSFDYVITVCDEANEACPVFTGEVKHRIHMGFEDPAKIVGSEEFIFSEFRRIRDQIEQKFKHFYIQNLKPQFDTSDSV